MAARREPPLESRPGGRRHLVVLPIEWGEVARFSAELDQHHWLGHRLVGEAVRYVATEDDRWVALVGFGSAAYQWAVRDRHLGWSREAQAGRLAWVVNNQRFCVLPAGRRPNLASQVLGQTLRRLSADHAAGYGHPVLAVETFTDPTRHRGTCYAAANFRRLGETAGYRRSGGRYHHHGQPQVCWLVPLRRDAPAILRAAFDHPVRATAPTRRPAAMVDLNRVRLTGGGSLLARLEGVPDSRKARGIRHRLGSILLVAAVALLSGANSFTAIGEWAEEASQDVLARPGTRRSPRTGRHVAPHEATVRRALQAVDVVALDGAVGGWLAEEVRQGRIARDQLAVAVDGKRVRGARQDEGRALPRFAAMVHREGVVVARRAVAPRPTRSPPSAPLREPLDLQGVVVTAGAMRTPVDHARFLVEEKGAACVQTY